jgi:hypothetical protein
MQIHEILDIRAPQSVEIQIRYDGRVVWVNVDGICRFRSCRIGELTITDERVEVVDAEPS